MHGSFVSKMNKIFAKKHFRYRLLAVDMIGYKKVLSKVMTCKGTHVSIGRLLFAERNHQFRTHTQSYVQNSIDKFTADILQVKSFKN